MIMIEHSVAPSPYGLGLFTLETLKKGQLVLNSDSRLIAIVPLTEIATFSNIMQRHFAKYAYAGKGKHRLHDALYYNVDNERFINHSDQPNLKYDAITECHYADEDLTAGTELTRNYLDFCEPGDARVSFLAETNLVAE